MKGQGGQRPTLLSFGVAPGTLTALADRDDRRAHFRLTGDLDQMGRMEAALRAAGFRVVKSDVYPGFAREDEEEYRRALRFLFERRVHGWWGQETALVSYGVCSQDEFDVALGRKVLMEIEVAAAVRMIGEELGAAGVPHESGETFVRGRGFLFQFRTEPDQRWEFTRVGLRLCNTSLAEGISQVIAAAVAAGGREEPGG